jgi:hypothetical protein
MLFLYSDNVDCQSQDVLLVSMCFNAIYYRFCLLNLSNSTGQNVNKTNQQIQDTVEYKKRMRPLKVKLEDGTVKTVLIDDSDTVAQVSTTNFCQFRRFFFSFFSNCCRALH